MADELEQWRRWLGGWLRYLKVAYGLTREDVLKVLGEVLPSESDTPAPSLPAPPLAATQELSRWREWLRRHS